jgi:hypothetical protein
LFPMFSFHLFSGIRVGLLQLPVTCFLARSLFVLLSFFF